MNVPDTTPIAGAVAAATAAVQATPEMAELMRHLVLQLAVIIVVARLSGFVFQRYLRLPSVLGELISGMVIGPFAFGRIQIPHIGALFPASDAVIPVSPALYGIATIASILLLFLSGLETDLATFLRFSTVGTAVGIGGVVFSFSLGAGCAVIFGVADSFMAPSAMFLGAISTATSVGITARILSEKNKTDSPEGVTILAGAVLDDVLGIVVLAVVVGMARVTETHGRIDWLQIGRVAAKAFGFWLVLTFVGLVSARRVTRALKHLHSNENIASIAMGLALLLAGLMEMAGLAMIIGAYVMGLSLSRTDLVHVIQNNLRGAYQLLVPVFFAVMGMLVDFSALHGMVLFGLVFSAVAVVSKVFGCALPAYMMKFNMRGALRIGAGMVPRGEVALIIASVGLSAHVIGPEVFGVSIMMTILTTFLAPPLLVKSFEGRSGLKAKAEMGKDETISSVTLEFPSEDLADFMLSRLVRGYRNEEFFVHKLGLDIPTYQIRKEDMIFTLKMEDNRITLTAPDQHVHIARFIALEELLVLQDLLESCEKIKSFSTLQKKLVAGLFTEQD